MIWEILLDLVCVLGFEIEDRPAIERALIGFFVPDSFDYTSDDSSVKSRTAEAKGAAAKVMNQKVRLRSPSTSKSKQEELFVHNVSSENFELEMSLPCFQYPSTSIISLKSTTMEGIRD